MAVDVVQVCATATTNQSSQSLAVLLSVLFSVYTFVAIALSALTIYTSSEVRPSLATRTSMAEKRSRSVIVGYAGDGENVPLMQIHS